MSLRPSHDSRSRSIIRFTLWGVGLGVCFPVVATALDLWVRARPFTWGGIVGVQAEQPLHWIIDTAPIFLGLFGYLVGRRQDVIDGLRERALEASEQVRIAVFDAVLDGVITIDETGLIDSANPAALRMFGYSLDELVGRNVRVLADEPHGSRHDGYLQRYVETGERRIIGIGREVMGRRRDGSVFPLDLGVSETFVPGKGRRFVGVLRDLTTERRLSEEADRFFNLSLDPLCISGAEGEFRRVNGAFTRLLGYSLEDLDGVRFLDLVHPDDRDALRPVLAAVRRGEPAERFEARCRCGDRSYRYIAWSAIPVVGEGIVYAVGRDVTEERAVSQAMRTARDAAEASSRAKSEFLANMSHEIRTPMNGILGMTRLTLDTELTPEQREYLRMVDQSAYALLDIINDILDFSKIEAGRLELESIPFGLRATLSAAFKALALRADEKGLELVYADHPDVPEHFIGDPGRLRQVVVNLVHNAVKFTEEGEVTVSIGPVERAGDAMVIRVSVRDTGIGIAPDKQSMIFEAFAQADGSTTRRYGGTGLGLAICSELVSLMGGEISVESQPGAGSTFSFTVRLAVDEEGVERASPVSAERLKGKRVLIVDDNDTNRRILEDSVARWGMESVSEADPRRALDMLGSGESFSLLLSDVHMPDMDGFQFVEAIRARGLLRDVPILLLTSGGQPGDGERCRALGVSAYLLKPITPPELLEEVARVLAEGEEEGTGEARGAAAAGEPREELASVGPRVLLAEDNLVNQMLARTLLEKKGYSVRVAENGIRAVEMYRTGRWDVVLMDVQMPEMDGLEATRRIRTLEGDGARTPVVAMTAHAMKGDRERCIEAGMDDYVSKPIEPVELYEALDRVLGGGVTGGGSDEPGDGTVAMVYADALEHAGEDESLLHALFELFLDAVPDRMRALTRAHEDRDASSLEGAAHALKGSAASLALPEVTRLAAALEKAGATGVMSGVEATLQELNGALERAEREIRAAMSQHA